MNQDKIWKYYQGERRDSFSGSFTRLYFLAREVARILKKNQGGNKVLNIGIGAGLFEREALKNGLDVYSLDPDEETVRGIASIFEFSGRAAIGRAEKNPFPDNFFNVVVISEVLEHLSDDVLSDSMKEIRRVLVPAGFVVGTVPARENLTESTVLCPFCGEKFHRWGHQRSFTVKSLSALMEEEFVVIKVVEKSFIQWNLANWKGRVYGVVKLLLNAFGIHGGGENIFFVCQK